MPPAQGPQRGSDLTHGNLKQKTNHFLHQKTLLILSGIGGPQGVPQAHGGLLRRGNNVLRCASNMSINFTGEEAFFALFSHQFRRILRVHLRQRGWGAGTRGGTGRLLAGEHFSTEWDSNPGPLPYMFSKQKHHILLCKIFEI